MMNMGLSLTPLLSLSIIWIFCWLHLKTWLWVFLVPLHWLPCIWQAESCGRPRSGVPPFHLQGRL
ncbi:hypothetical protein Hanom_Chr06g00545311 [Helianthus anomalus]